MTQSLPDMVMRDTKGPSRARQPEVRASRTKRETAVALAGVPLFADLPKKHLRWLAHEADELAFTPGEQIVREGSLGETLFVVMEGRAKVTRNGRRVGEVLPGDFFGELSTIDGGPRTASITAVTPIRVVRLFRRTLRKLLEGEPQLATKILDGVVRRIRQVERRSG
ncbi:MAG: cyclic nucleotide-binding domain-containing protein [Actinobacteria bacterium]|nr:MAG: cyclic nucleotide-binding domain-containing protein [Actinomycetota bacterium]